MSLCSVLIGHKGSVTKVRTVDKNLCIEANLRPVSGPCQNQRSFTPSLLFCGSLGLGPCCQNSCWCNKSAKLSRHSGRLLFCCWGSFLWAAEQKILHLSGNAASWNKSFSRGHGGEQTEVTSRLAFHPVKAAPSSLPSIPPPPNWLSVSPLALAALSLVIFSAAVQSQMLSFPVVRQKIGHCLFIFNVLPAVYMQIYQTETK